jgi:nucleotide-binding universal stress UspA family protein
MDHIMVGVDGSPHAAHALRWALDESRLRRCALTAVLAWDYLGQHHPDGSTAFDPSFDAAGAARSIEAFVVDAVGADDARCVDATAVFGLAAEGLLEAAASASLLVLGARGLGGFRELLLGSVSQRCLHEAACSVAIVRRDAAVPTNGFGRVVVGVDGSAHGDAALAWAAREAAMRHAGLRVVHVCPDTINVAFLPQPTTAQVVADKPARAVLEAALGRVIVPDGIDVELVAASGSAAKALLAASADADLIVIGRSGRRLLTGLALGSTATQISHHSPIPAVFVRSDDAIAPADG